MTITNPTEHLDTTTSQGRRMPYTHLNENTGATTVYDRQSAPCPGCGQVTSDGQTITKVFRTWWHDNCARAYLEVEGKDEAWLVLGRQLANRPTHFKATETRAIVEQLVRIANGQLEPRQSINGQKYLG